MSYYSEKIAEIKKKMQTKKTAPVYEPEKWLVNGKPLFTNCYAYALDLDVSDPKTTIFIPGSISNENACKQIYTLDTFVKNFFQDLNFLGISHRDDVGVLQPGEYRVGVFTSYIYSDVPMSIHFVRQDSDGKWSEKWGWDGSVMREYDITTDEPMTVGVPKCKLFFGSIILRKN